MIITGMLIISWALYVRLDTMQKEKAMIKSFNAAVEAYQNNPEYTADNEVQVEETDTAIKNMLGILSIPSIDLEVALVDGVDAESLKRAVGHFKETPMPGEKGNCAISGHRSYTYSQFFNRLDEVEPGDEVIIKTKTGEYKYVAYDKKIVEPDDISVLKNTDDPILTLITCHPQRSSAHRLVVTCRLK